MLAKIVELIYFAKNSKIFLHNHFLENLLNCSYTNCKTKTNFLGVRSPGGSNFYISSWLSEQANEPLV